MSMRIPTPELIGELIDGGVYAMPGRNVLVLGTAPAALVGKQPVLSGSLVVRYALPMLEPPTEAIIPGLFAAEKGGILVGRAAWDYIQQQFQLHPRADIVGLRLNGAKAQVFLRELDLGAPVRVLVYSTAEATTPAAEVSALAIGHNAPPLPELLANYLPVTDLNTLPG